MKTLLIVLLILLPVHSLFSVDTTREKKTPSIVELQVNAKKNLIKSLLALTSAGLFGYLSYESHELHHSPKLLSSANERNKEMYIPNNLNLIDTILIFFSDALKYPVYQRLSYFFKENNKEEEIEYFYDENYWYHNIGIIINALIAFECAKYGFRKFYSVLMTNDSFVKYKLYISHIFSKNSVLFYNHPKNSKQSDDSEN